MRQVATADRPGPGGAPLRRSRDLHIVDGLRRRDEAALEDLFNDYGGLICRWSRSDDAEDIVQDVLLRVWQAGDRLDPDTSLPGYLKTVTQNTVRNRWRTRVRKPVVPVGLEPPTDADGDDPIERRTDRMAVEQVLNELAPREREVLRLLYVSDLPLDEVADRLQASREATKSLAARARRRFRTKVEQALAGTAVAGVMTTGRVAHAADVIGRHGLGAVASAAVGLVVAGALTFASLGGSERPPNDHAVPAAAVTVPDLNLTTGPEPATTAVRQVQPAPVRTPTARPTPSPLVDAGRIRVGRDQVDTADEELIQQDPVQTLVPDPLEPKSSANDAGRSLLDLV